MEQKYSGFVLIWVNSYGITFLIFSRCRGRFLQCQPDYDSVLSKIVFILFLTSQFLKVKGEIFEFESRARSRSNLISRSAPAMALYRPSLFDCLQAGGSVEEISYNDPELLPEDRFSDSSDDVGLRNISFSTSSRLRPNARVSGEKKTTSTPQIQKEHSNDRLTSTSSWTNSITRQAVIAISFCIYGVILFPSIVQA